MELFLVSDVTVDKVFTTMHHILFPAFTSKNIEAILTVLEKKKYGVCHEGCKNEQERS